ncbi:MAG: GNAT family N-acetyltransferase [Acidobacteriota bacterium]|nr:GNAT family N-acetyltransferase [Acidobacteriota bacterium]
MALINTERPRLNTGISVRPAKVCDAHAIARIHVAAWKSTYQGIVPQPVLDSLDVSSRADDWTSWLDADGVKTFVAEKDDELCGFASGSAIREALSYVDGDIRTVLDAEVYAIYLLPSAKGQGTGKLLMHHLAKSLRVQGFQSLAVWVLAENPSCGFYEHLGGTRISRKTLRIGDSDLPEIAYAWSDIRVLADWA